MHPDLYAPPNAGALIHSLRSVGYSFETAIADIVDNSISAGASVIHINVIWTNELQYISICDNGDGMSEQDLHNAMVLGSKDPTEIRTNKDLGRFGLGMKTAAFSLCKRFFFM